MLASDPDRTLYLDSDQKGNPTYVQTELAIGYVLDLKGRLGQTLLDEVGSNYFWSVMHG